MNSFVKGYTGVAAQPELLTVLCSPTALFMWTTKTWACFDVLKLKTLGTKSWTKSIPDF